MKYQNCTLIWKAHLNSWVKSSLTKKKKERKAEETAGGRITARAFKGQWMGNLGTSEYAWALVNVLFFFLHVTQHFTQRNNEIVSFFFVKSPSGEWRVSYCENNLHGRVGSAGRRNSDRLGSSDHLQTHQSLLQGLRVFVRFFPANHIRLSTCELRRLHSHHNTQKKTRVCCFVSCSLRNHPNHKNNVPLRGFNIELSRNINFPNNSRSPHSLANKQMHKMMNVLRPGGWFPTLLAAVQIRQIHGNDSNEN